ncbi:MAG: DUF4091 domain-containing protein [Acidipila sp.]|nr:DUF4091 domain-containing protein [Acidipila sp.]
MRQPMPNRGEYGSKEVVDRLTPGRRTACFTCLVLFVLATWSGRSPRADTLGRRLSAQIVTGPIKIRPYTPLPPAAKTPVHCARNQFCSFQVVVSATTSGLRNVNIRITDLHGPHDSRIVSAPATIYLEGFTNIFYRSSEQGDIGEWPDPLIPAVDAEYGETRNALPLTVGTISPAYKRYGQRRGRAIPGGRGLGEVLPAGQFAGAVARRYVLEIVKPGPAGVATFRWWSNPGTTHPNAERVTSAAPLALDSGVSVAFHGSGTEEDYLQGDEFWIFAGPERHQPLWVDLLIPTDAVPGSYSGSVYVSAAGSPDLELPIQIEVFDFALPSTMSLANSFQMSWSSLAKAHFPETLPDPAKDEARKIQLGKAYARAALQNGITVTPSEDLAPVYSFLPDGALAPADYSRYDDAVGGFMDGSQTPRGARWTSLPLPRLKRLSEAQRTLALRDFIHHAHEHRGQDRLYDYTYDEPSTPEDFAKLKSRARLVRDIDPSIPRLVTTNLNSELVGLVTRWCPAVNALEPKFGSPLDPWRQPHRAARGEYEPRLKAGESLWWYQSCSSHGCDGNGPSPQYDNWPSTMIDASAIANRVFGFLSAVNYRIAGILYWDVAYAHSLSPAPGNRGLSPWESQYYFGGNGDGSLFYPGTPERVGGRRDIPIESLRLKMIRESFYDAEYALLLRQLGEQEFLNKEVGGVVEKAWRWSADPQAWLDLREQLARRIALHSSRAGKKQTR